MEFHFNYDREIVDHYLPLLSSPDFDIRCTAIVDIILQGVYKEHPFEFYALMHEFDNMYTPDSSGQHQYHDLCRALHSYRSISGLYLREEIDLLMASVFPSGQRSNNQIELLNGQIQELGYKIQNLSTTVQELHSIISHLQIQNTESRGLINSLQFRIDNGQYESRGERINC